MCFLAVDYRVLTNVVYTRSKLISSFEIKAEEVTYKLLVSYCKTNSDFHNFIGLYFFIVLSFFHFSDLSRNRLSHIDAGTLEGISDKLSFL